MKALKITKGFNQLLNTLRVHHMDVYTTLSEVVVQIIAGKNQTLLQEALELSKTIKENKNTTTVWINNETYDTLKIVQSRYKERYNKTTRADDSWWFRFFRESGCKWTLFPSSACTQFHFPAHHRFIPS